MKGGRVNEDPLGPARGVVVGVVIGLGLWALLWGAFLVWVTR